MIVKLQLPFPSKELSPNSRVHWRRKALAVKCYRQECGWLAKSVKQSLQPLEPPVSAAVTFVVPDKRRRDIDNLSASLKPLWDGLVDVGLLVDDSHDKLRLGAPVVRYEKGQSCVEVELTEGGPYRSTADAGVAGVSKGARAQGGMNDAKQST